MYDQQNGSNSWTNGYAAQRVPSLLTGFVNPVQFDQPPLVLKDQCGQFEADSSVLALILPVLSFIPFVAHNVYTYYITNKRLVSPPWPSAILRRERFRYTEEFRIFLQARRRFYGIDCFTGIAE